MQEGAEGATAAVAGMAGQKMRLNVSALAGARPDAKFLICVGEGEFVQDLAVKVRRALAKIGVAGELLRLDNVHRALLPEEEPVGDVLRDGDEVIAVLRVPEPRAAADVLRLPEAQAAPIVEDFILETSIVPVQPLACVDATQEEQGAEPTNWRELAPLQTTLDSSELYAQQDAALAPKVCWEVQALEAGDLEALLAVEEDEEEEAWQPVPGPATAFEEDLRELAAADHRADRTMQVGQPRRGFRFEKGPGDWEVADITPKLREFIATRFKEVRGSLAEPGNTFITVTMSPQQPETGPPVHYSMARVDVIEFERLSARKLQEAWSRVEYFIRSREALEALLERGAAPEDYAPNMLPYRFRAGDEFDGLLKEANSLSFGQVEGNHPIIILDTSGAAGEVVPVLRAALKRMLYSFLVTKSKFNFLRFSPQGQAFAFDAEMVPPVAQRLREAEEWLDTLRPVRVAGAGPALLEALRLALAAREVDVVYLLTAGLPKRQDAERMLAEVRVRNVRGVPIHTIGVNCEVKSELELRRLAEDSKGSFRQWRLDTATAGTARVETRSAPLRPNREDARLTIGGQVDILDIMVKEEESQASEWLEEQRCANQLLLATATQQPVPDPVQARAAAIRTAGSLAQRPRLQDLIEGMHGQPLPPVAAQALAGGAPGAAATAAAAAAARRRPASRCCGGGSEPRMARHLRSASSRPRPGAEVGDAARRPFVANPWDRPHGEPSNVVRVSQLKQRADDATQRGAAPSTTGVAGPCPRGQGGMGSRRSCSTRGPRARSACGPRH